MTSPYAPDAAFWSGRRVFLTGHTGFKGGWLAAWLAHLGAEVHGYSLAPERSPSLFEVVGVAGLCRGSTIGDLRDAPRLAAALAEARPEIVFHLAAQPLVRRSYREPVETFSTNVMGTVTLLEALRARPELRAAIVVTSDKCYENRELGQPFREDDPLGGHDCYSASKAAQEIVAASYRASFLKAAGVRLATARAGNVIGGGDWGEDRLVPDVVQAFAAGRPLVVRNPEAVRPWQHVADPLLGYLRLARACVEGGERFASAWNFGPALEDIRPVRVVAERMARAWGGGASWRAEPQDNAPAEAGLLRLDAEKARNDLGWRPLLDFDGMIAETVHWYRAWHQGEDACALSRRMTALFAGARERASCVSC
ncbi:MAG: CDP-glucose 4,6-dehydratase [Alphaproteobacteria bacterium]|nr:CDP-glucose 4,6-dehydratase [Alphaproteobacteria bacterium]